jgi:monothiol glutaredoxin
MASNTALQTNITDLLSSHRVVLFMKGNRQSPQCGFSARVVQILDNLLPDYATIDVLSDPQVRQSIKEYSDWPTIPQLYVDGTFIGGCDIVTEMNASGALQEVLGVQGAPLPVTVPTITISAAAVQAIEGALRDAPGESLRLQVSPKFEHDLLIGPKAADDVEVHTNGLVVLLDPQTASRADGISIDFLAGPDGGFKIDNPNEPPRTRSLSPQQLKTMLDRQEVILFDVRPEHERKVASIPAARPLDEAGQAYLQALDPSAPIALYCHHGIRSQSAAQELVQHGFRNVYNLSGGIDAWSQTVDPAIPRY